jgi:phosphatidylserine/phosphatidylglycerophosphate/cardiolipin synthase-like enzyme
MFRLKDLLAIITELGIELHPDRISILADKITDIDSFGNFAQIKSAFGSNINKTMVAQFESAWKSNEEISPKETAIALRSASTTALESEKRGKIEIVWTGPSTGQVPVRHTEQVLCEIINYAQRDIFIVSFVAYKIDTVIKAMRDAIGRNVQINFLLESSIEHGGKVSQDSIKMMKSLFPSANIYSWSEKSDSSIEHHDSSIHAKCAIADGELAFITSANLTTAAMERNIELGVLIRGGKIPGELNKHLNSLINAKVFEKFSV